jgi:hypothetical protein
MLHLPIVTRAPMKTSVVAGMSGVFEGLVGALDTDSLDRRGLQDES